MALTEMSVQTTPCAAAPESPYGDALAAHLPMVRAVVNALARRHRLSTDGQQDLLSDVLLRLVHDDYAALRQFRGEALLKTYLFTVARRVLLDQRTKAWGKWRPSRRCRSLGKAAERLDRLIRRDRVPWQDAVALVTHAPDLECTFETAVQLSRQIGGLSRPWLVPLLPHHVQSVGVRANDPLEQRDAQRHRRWVREAMRSACRTLPAPDLRLLAARFAQGQSVADIARARGVEQKTLYRRFDRICAQLRQHLIDRGMTMADVRAIQAGT